MLSSPLRSPVRGDLHLAPFLHEDQNQLLGILESYPDSGLRGLLRESHPGILFNNLFLFAQTQEQKNQEDLAKKIYQFLSQHKNVPALLAKKSQERVEVLNEGGPVGLWLERWTRKGLYEMTSTKLILEMTIGGMGARLGRVAGGLLARAGGMGALGTWLLPRTASFLSETAAFSSASLVLTRPFPETPFTAYGQIFKSSGLMFASMRLSRALLPGSSALQASAATYLGIVGNHAIQQNLFHWEENQGLSAMMRQSLAEAVTFSLGGHVTQLTMGRLLAPLEHSLDLAAARNERPLIQSLLPAFAAQGIFSGERSSLFSNLVFTKSQEGGPKDPSIPAGGRGGTQLIGPEDGLATAETVDADTPPPKTVVVKKEPTVQGEKTPDPALAGTVLAPAEITPDPLGVRPLPPETPAPPPLPRDLMPTVDAPPDSQRTPRPTMAPMSHTEIGIGSRLGDLVEGEPRFEVVALLGEGGQGLVWKVIDHKMEKSEAVIKVLRGEAEPEIVKRQKREYQLGTHLKSKTDKIAAVYDLLEINGIKIPVMAFVEGKPLDVILNKIHRGDETATRTYTVKKRIETFVKIAEAVEELHNLSVMHRDLKPPNIMVNENGQVRLLDLGIGKVFAETEPDPQRLSMIPLSLQGASKQNLTKAGHFFGTPGFWAPEMLMPDSYITKNPRSYDVFALGSILYEMITGVPAFASYEKGNPAKGEPALVPVRTPDGIYDIKEFSVLQLDKSMEPPSFQEVMAGEVDGDLLELEAVVRKAIAPQPKDRYQSAEEMSRAVQMVFARVEKRRLDKMQDEMELIKKEMDEVWAKYRPSTQAPEYFWRELKAPIKRLTYLNEDWHRGGEKLIVKIIATMKGEQWPEGQRLMAQIGWERLLAYGDRIHPNRRADLEELIRENDIRKDDGIISGMREALNQPVKIAFEAEDIETGQKISEDLQVRVIPMEYMWDSRGYETDHYRKGEPIFDGALSRLGESSGLKAGYYVFEISASGYAPMKVPRQVTLEGVRKGIQQKSPLVFPIEMVPLSKVPKEGNWYVIQGGEFVLGYDFYNEGSPFKVYSYPITKKVLKTFLMSDPITVNDWRKFVEEKIQSIPSGKFKEMNKYILEKIQPLLPMDTAPIKMEGRLKKFLTSAMERIRKKKETEEEDRFFWAIYPEKVDKKIRWHPNNPENPVDHHDDPVLPDQPIATIDVVAVKEYLRWRNEKDNTMEKFGNAYRLPMDNELEGVARNGFDWPYSSGYELDPYRVVSRMAFPDVKSTWNQRVGTIPSGKESWDVSLFGPKDLIGNVREFTMTEAEENSVYIFGGYTRAPYGPYFEAAGRSFWPIWHRQDGVGGFRLVLELSKDGE